MYRINTYTSLYNAAQLVLKNPSTGIKAIVAEIKKSEQSKITALKSDLVALLKQAVYEQREKMSSQGGPAANSLDGLSNESDKWRYLNKFKYLCGDDFKSKFNVYFDRQLQTGLCSLDPEQGSKARRVHVLPADFDARRKRRQSQSAQLIMNIKKEHLDALIQFLPQLLSQQSMPWIEQVIFSGADRFGRGQGDVVIVLSEANINYAKQLKDYLASHLEKDAFVDTVPLRTYQLASGIAYAEICGEKELLSTTPSFSVKNIVEEDEEYIGSVLSTALLTEQSLEDVLLAGDEKQSTAGDSLLGLSSHRIFSHRDDEGIAHEAIQNFLIRPDQFITANSVTTKLLSDDDIGYRPARRFAKFIEIEPNQYEIVSVNRKEKIQLMPIS